MQKTMCIENLTLMLRLGFHEFETELPQGVSVDLQVNVAGEVSWGQQLIILKSANYSKTNCKIRFSV